MTIVLTPTQVAFLTELVEYEIECRDKDARSATLESILKILKEAK